MPSEAALPAEVRRRLHPWSWLFVALASIKELALPLLALLVFGSGEWWEFVGAGAAVFVALYAVLQYFTYRYGVVGRELVIRSGVLARNTRHIPLERIRNVGLRRSPLHRLFGVAEVRLESAVVGAKAEAHMRVLSLAAAHEIEQLVQDLGAASTEDSASEDELLLALPTSELVRLGLISNRGMIVLAALFGGLFQIAPDSAGDLIGGWSKALFGQASALALGPLQWVVAVLALVVAGIIALRTFSVLLAILQFHGFRLERRGQRLSLERGLLTRSRARAPLSRIQQWTVTETLLHRWFGRQGVEVETAVLQTAGDSNANLHALAPVATPDKVRSLLAQLAPFAPGDGTHWQGLHPRAWRRMAFWPVLLTLAIGLPLAWWLPWTAIGALVLLPWWVLLARRSAAAAGIAYDGTVLARRSGWLDRRMSFIEVDKLQGLQLYQSPWDRRRGMATLVADSVGANPMGHRIHVRFLDAGLADGLYLEIARRLSRRSAAPQPEEAAAVEPSPAEPPSAPGEPMPG